MRQGSLLICFTGIDGSGKTTQAKLLLDWLKSKGIKSKYVWSRGEVLTIRRIFLFFGRRFLGTTENKIASSEQAHREYQSRKSSLMRNSLVRTLWSTMTYLEHLIQINMDIRRKMRDGCIVVCDRYLWDSSVDMATLNHKDHQWLSGGWNRLAWKFVPKPTITFFIDIPPEEAMKRKSDIPSITYVRERAEAYRYLATRNSFSVINGCKDPIAIENEIKRTIDIYLEGEVANG